VNRTSIRRFAGVLTLGLAAAALLGACGDDDDVTGGDPTEAADLEVSGAWARTSPAVATAGAAYLEIVNGSDLDDVLTAASVDESVAAEVELHETSEATDQGMGDDAADAEGMGDDPAGGEGMGGDDADDPMGSPMMRMQPVDEIPVPAGATVVLEPGGLHIMMLDLAAPLEVGSTIELVLTFEQAGDVVVTAEVRDSAP
jgi:periplasmic copper chaperone A